MVEVHSSYILGAISVTYVYAVMHVITATAIRGLQNLAWVSSSRVCLFCCG